MRRHLLPKPTGGNSSDRLIERKQMSTKTTFKRIALVAVAALGFGVLTSVAPASAAGNADVTAITAGASAPARVGVTSGDTTITLTVPAGTTSLSLTAQLASAPSTSAKASLLFSAASSKPAASATYEAIADNENSATAKVGTLTDAEVADVSSATASASTTTNFKLQLRADVAGTYQVLVAVGGDTTTGYAAANKSVVYSITTAGTPTSVVLSKYAGTPIGGTDSASSGAILAVSLKDASGAATILGLNEALAITHTAGTTTDLGATSLGSGSTQDPRVGGYAVTLKGNSTTVDGSDVVTVTGGGVLPSTLTTTLSVTTVAGNGTLTGTFALTSATGYKANTAPAYYNYAKTSHGFTFTPSATDAAARSFAVKVTKTNGLEYSTYVTVAAAATTGTVTVSEANSSTDANAISVQVGSITATTFTYQVPAATTTTVVSPAAGAITATGGSTVLTAKIVDQYGNKMVNQLASVAVTGRNTVASTALGVTDASGLVSYTLKDAGTAGTTDSVIFTLGGVASSAFTVTYANVTVGSLSLTGGSTTANVTSAAATINPIEADDTPESATQDIVVTVKDANGAILNGVPVTFSVAGTGAAITTNTVTAYSTGTGKATAKIYAWLAGTYVVTATAGGKTATGSYTFANSRPADARVVSATVNGNLVVAKVVDRFGNPVQGVTVFATKSNGNGYFGNGVTKTYDTTAADGTVEFAFTGTADVTVSTVDYRTTSTVGSGQTSAAAGNIDYQEVLADATAFTATTAGTALTAAANVGSTYAPAGVKSATVSLSTDQAAAAAADAAAEATDAANAATDAANAAAEAADAATAAAQDAADAVAALSTQVTEMVSALKKQITALTNLVIKIQKKVKA